jgi:hypothetical protein
VRDLVAGLVPIVLGLASLIAPWVLSLRSGLAVTVVLAGGILLILVGLTLAGPALRGRAPRNEGEQS